MQWKLRFNYHLTEILLTKGEDCKCCTPWRNSHVSRAFFTSKMSCSVWTSLQCNFTKPAIVQTELYRVSQEECARLR